MKPFGGYEHNTSKADISTNACKEGIPRILFKLDGIVKDLSKMYPFFVIRVSGGGHREFSVPLPESEFSGWEGIVFKSFCIAAIIAMERSGRQVKKGWPVIFLFSERDYDSNF